MGIVEEKRLRLIDTDGKSSKRRRIRGLGRFSWEDILMTLSMEERSRRGAAVYTEAFGCCCDSHRLKAERKGRGLRSSYLSSATAEERGHTHQNEKATHKTVNTQSFQA